MSLRLSLILVIAACWVGIGATFAVDQFGREARTEQPPFFFTVAPDDLRNISISTLDDSVDFHFREDERRWYFDDLDDVPTALYRWGGITQLLGGPRTQRELASEITDPALYGLDQPKLTISVTLRDGTELAVEMGDLTPDQSGNYFRQAGYNQLYTVDASWGQVMTRLVEEPPIPEWFYTMNPEEATEILFFEGNEVVKAFALNEESGSWIICDLPTREAPCVGDEPADSDSVASWLDSFSNPEIAGAETLNLPELSDFEAYGAGRDAPYVHIRREVEVRERLTNVYRTSLIIGDATDDGLHRYAVANEASDVILVNRDWADSILEFFRG